MLIITSVALNSASKEIVLGGSIESGSGGGVKAKNLSKASSFKMDFLTSKAQIAFIRLQKVFIKASILYQFYTEHYIQI